MKKKWLIDAHNVIHKIPELARKLPIDHLSVFSGFCRMVQQRCELQQMQARLVFDGVAQILPKFSKVEVFFSRERTADEVIISILRKENASSKWVVVTDDREIRQHAYYYRVDILRTDDFVKMDKRPEAAKPREEKKTVTDPGKAANPEVDVMEVEEMMRLFGRKNKKSE